MTSRCTIERSCLRLWRWHLGGALRLNSDGLQSSEIWGLRQVLSVPGRCFPVEVVHSLEDHSRDYLQAAIDTAIDIHVEQPEGDACLSTRGDTHCMKICRTGACTSITVCTPSSMWQAFWQLSLPARLQATS